MSLIDNDESPHTHCLLRIAEAHNANGPLEGVLLCGGQIGR